MTFYTNRKGYAPLFKLVENVERNTNKKFDMLIFRTLLTVYPDSYTVYLHKNNLAVKVKSDKIKMDFSDREKRGLSLSKKLSEYDATKFIEVDDLPKPKVYEYKSAKEMIEENILKFDYESEEESDDNDNNYKANLPIGLVKAIKRTSVFT